MKFLIPDFFEIEGLERFIHRHLVDISTIFLILSYMTKKIRLIYQLNIARHSMMKSMDARCREDLGISAVQFTVLHVLQEQDNCLMKDLARILMIDKSAITGLVQRMLDKELIVKRGCAQDSRASRINITEKGEEILERGASLVIEANEVMKDGFSKEELATVSRYLDHLTKVFSERKEKL